MSSPDRNRRVVYRDATISLGGVFAGRTRGYRYFCKTCGDLWAWMDLSDDPSGEYTILCFPCEQHGTQYQTGGSTLKPLMWWDAWTGPDFEKAWERFSREYQNRELLARCNQILGA